MSAVQLSNKIKEGTLTSKELVVKMIARCNEVNPKTNAIVELYEEDAVRRAEEIDQYIARFDKSSSAFAELKAKKPFLGVPFTIKNSYAVKGKKLYCGLHYRLDESPCDKDAVIVERLRKAGSFPLASTNVPPAVIAWESDNCITGRTSSPYDLRCTSGGSSGGEGSLIASQGSVMGIGSDIAGSIRMPSLLSGIFGIKPFIDTIDPEGHWPGGPKGSEVMELPGYGPMCRYAEDLPVIFDAIADVPAPSDFEKRAPKNLIVCPGLDTDYCLPLSEPQRDAWSTAVKFLSKEYGLEPSKYTMPPTKDMMKMYQNTVMPHMFRDSLLGYENGSLEREMVKALFGLSKSRMSALMLAHQLGVLVPENEKSKWSDAKKKFIESFFRLVDNGTVFVFPAFPKTHYFHNEPIPAVWDTFYTAVFNLLGAPAMVVPMGLDKDGYPRSVQLVTARNNDYLLCKVALDLSKKFGGWTPPRV
uniref:Amidase domain-containing protein n=2 Tax=Bursaphelenchus xylophilus TaxID=6326 RepID=A0A1I7RQ96_BURXY